MITLTVFSALSSYAVFELAWLYLAETDRDRTRRSYWSEPAAALTIVALGWLLSIAIAQIIGG